MVILGAIQLRLDDVDQVVAGLVHRLAADDAVHGDHGNFARRIVVLEQEFVQIGTHVARNPVAQAALEVQRLRNQLGEIAEQTDQQQNQQNDGKNHPTPAAARFGRW